MATSAATIPQVTSVVEADYGAVMASRDSWEGPSRRPTPLAYVLHAVGAVLPRHRELTASVEGASLVLHDRVDVALAVDTPEGLVAPVLRAVDERSVAEIADLVVDLAERARLGTLRPAELTGATFTVTNNGSAGSVLTTPLVTPPQVAVLSTDKVVRRAVVVDLDGQPGVVVRPMGNLSMTWDHRAIDGAQAARFLDEVAAHLVRVGGAGS
jgi:2-oxoglutarate dehydrogenase E2 component (dihydrolipoamide succinyltransferase)